MRIAFKEWAIIADALATGRQIIILRKGGISEGPGGFAMDYPEFLIFPTLFHQQRDSVLPEAQQRFDQIQTHFPPPEKLRIDTFCRVAEWRQLNDLAAAQRLQGQHIWKPEVIAERFDWGRNKAIFALAVRAYKLSDAFELPMLAAYGGCKSWIDLDREIPINGATPALSETEFTQRLQEFKQAVA